jgi:hypothetical protein
MRKNEKRKRREYFSAHYVSGRAQKGLSIGLLEYLIEDDCFIPRLRGEIGAFPPSLGRRNPPIQS